MKRDETRDAVEASAGGEGADTEREAAEAADGGSDGGDEASVDVPVEVPLEVDDELDTELIAARRERDEARQKAAEYQDKFLRALADLENVRKRSAREQQDAVRFGNENLLHAMLAPLDNLDLALKHADTPIAKLEDLREGLRMVFAQFLDTLSQFGVKTFRATGEQFDPHLHDAIEQVVTAERPPGTVLDELKRGWRLQERLLRPALVRVAAAPAEAAAAGDGDGEAPAGNGRDPDAEQAG